MSWTLTTSGAAISKAGLNANSDIIASSATLAKWSDQAEAAVSAITRKDWVADYGDVSTNFKAVLDDTVSDFIAMRIIGYDMTGYLSLAESQTILDVIRDNQVRNLEILKNMKNKEVFI